ncbi:conserved Plasmodium protein, unknown function [Plasmodium berghei]|uniref:Uncharacterized protein n=2 Tax=Plasmodium berghei TaxID=5821 RepID=A0A509AML4_PLABA|nr:conserved protein, unknown function [Plasmodium berghei ANKA]CXI83743.1 conserved Plasmodium protein, unknown function [Plasmodium berghei]SCM25729.1 conserved Plasmodium protein, unknown function [Plasmodium berghei]SCN27471.1 conserved Plasmodium protein, unknown function [Plasmodium berghei]SCO62185.1 conserved Plasmodium protein, unknown function [Plasmodium berghei]SCO63898.1 conserved Plasmodium protein, unknown function [Plasmodium berghei]|eukprot:XP_034423103.1 conserved protein, unknown function [Plasmodium berghei ANKA]
MNKENDSYENISPFPCQNQIYAIYKKDSYMKHCLVKNHIEPIPLDQEVHFLNKKEEVTFKLTEILKSLETPKQEKETDDVVLPEYFEHKQPEQLENNELNSYKINCGVYLHEVNIIDKTSYNSITDKYNKYGNINSNQISIKGDMYVKNVIHFQECSQYNFLYKVHKIEWFIGLDINDNRIHEIIPQCQGTCFQIPFESLGKYIFCKAYRRVYKNTIYQKQAKNTIFDPHTYSTIPIKFKTRPEYVEICSITSKGPVLLSIDSSFQILKHLCNKYFHIKVILEDPLNNLENLSSYSSSDDASSTTNSKESDKLNQSQIFLITMHIDFDQIKFYNPNFYIIPTKNNEINCEQNNINTHKKNDKIIKKYKMIGNGGNNNLSHSKYYSNSNSSITSSEATNNFSEKNNQKITPIIQCDHKENSKKEKKISKEKINNSGNENKMGAYNELIFNLYEVEFRLSNKDNSIILIIGNNLKAQLNSVKYKMMIIKPLEKTISTNDLWTILLSFKSAYPYKSIFKKYSKIIYKNTNISFVQNMLNNYLIKSQFPNVHQTLPIQKISTIFNQ